MKEIDIRRSIRDFENLPVSDEDITKILRAGMQAPSAGNQRPWEFVVVTNKDTIDMLSKASPYAGPCKNSNTLIVLLANKTKLRFAENIDQDMGACAQNILLETVHLGLGGVWLGISPLKDRMEKVSEILVLDENYIPFALIPIGVPKNNSNKYIDRFEENRITFIK